VVDPLISDIVRDRFFMRKALGLAERGRGRTSPNPMVGALVVDGDGVVVGRGAHEFAGGAHAEVHALRDAGTRARGATLYCTLEPCRHVGRTGPCAPLVAGAGIARVVVANEDPNPLAGGGNTWLRQRGIAVTTGVLAPEGRRLNAPFFSVIGRGRPFVTMKVALSLDGKIAGQGGARTAITGAAAQRLVHRDRAEVDALAVGSGTMLSDDPLLTPRGAFRQRPLTRVIYDRRLRTTCSARLFSTLAAGPVIVVTTVRALRQAPRAVQDLRSAGAEILPIDTPGPLRTSLEALAARGVCSVVVEGGARLHRAFWDAGLVDRVQMYVADCVIGDTGMDWLPDAVISSTRIVARKAWPIGQDVLVEAHVHGVD
jgi:diaminohydroxyphosphoribosylaminopyrimidine deaminase/5-amino-6-(5-phosphoribosylamino)uracil reductase